MTEEKIKEKVKTRRRTLDKPEEKDDFKPKGNYVYAIGRRKEASATVRFYTKGTGRLLVNGRDWKKYFQETGLQHLIEQPLKIAKESKNSDFLISVRGGGVKGQAQAVQLGIARSIVKNSIELKKSMRTAGLLSVDSRVKERKKYGLKRARRGPQFSKR